MDSTLPPDPYKALGLTKDVDQATIKSTYRKLVLKCHPDKVTDESLKKQKQEEFHKIQQAWEAIGDEDKRDSYDALVKLEQLRKEKLERHRGAPSADVKGARYEVRTQAPASAGFSPSSSHRFEERKPASRSSYDDRKYDTYDAYPKQAAPRSSREKEASSRSTKGDRTRSDHNKTRDKEDRRDRDRRFVSVDSESSTDEKDRYEKAYKRRSDEARKLKEEDEYARRKLEELRFDHHDRERKTSHLAEDAARYIRQRRVEAERPSPSRTTSSRDVRPSEYYDRDSRSHRERDRPDTVRRSSARRSPPRHHDPIVDWADERKVPSFKQSSSSPADLHVPRAMPSRSYTESSREHRRTETSPSPSFRRSETMPSVPSSRRKDSAVPRPSGLRESVTPHDSGNSSSEAFPTVASPSISSKKYYYPTPGGGVRLSPDDVGVANGRRTVLREPDRRHRSPSPLSRPPMGANRPSEASYSTAKPKVSPIPPPLSRSSTLNVDPVRSSDDRGRRPLYGEVSGSGSERLKRENARRQTSFAPEQVAYASTKYGHDDVNWAPSSRGRDMERDREGGYAKPMLGRHATFAY